MEAKASATDEIRQQVESEIRTADPKNSSRKTGNGAGTRPKAGRTQKGEPTKLEITDALLNRPSDEFIIKVNGTDYPMVELTMTESLAFLATLETAAEVASLSLIPAIKIGLKLWALRSLSDDKKDELRVIALAGDPDNLRMALEAYGITEATDQHLRTLIGFASDARNFMIEIGKIFIDPFYEALKDESSIATILIKCQNRVPELVQNILVSSLLRRHEQVDIDKVKADIEFMDVIDGIEVITRQFQHYKSRGKIDLFTNLSGILFPLRRDTETPTE